MADAINKTEDVTLKHIAEDEVANTEPSAEQAPEQDAAAAAPPKAKGFTTMGRAVLAHARMTSALGDKKAKEEASTETA